MNGHLGRTRTVFAASERLDVVSLLALAVRLDDGALELPRVREDGPFAMLLQFGVEELGEELVVEDAGRRGCLAGGEGDFLGRCVGDGEDDWFLDGACALEVDALGRDEDEVVRRRGLLGHRHADYLLWMGDGLRLASIRFCSCLV